MFNTEDSLSNINENTNSDEIVYNIPAIEERFDLTSIIKKLDGSYLVNNGLYHVPSFGEWEGLWNEVNDYALAHPEVVTEEEPVPEPSPEEILAEAKLNKKQQIDSETSNAILAGFNYNVNGENLHFSYDSFDQQNFADTANVSMLAMSTSEMSELPSSVTWNAYRNYTHETGGELVRLTFNAISFIELYIKGAIAHKATQMEIGGRRKALVESANSIEDLASI